MDIVVEEISNSDVHGPAAGAHGAPHANPDRNRLDPYPWNDQRLMAAVGAMTERPQQNWTVEQLATLGMSRSAFAARFRDQFGHGNADADPVEGGSRTSQ